MSCWYLELLFDFNFAIIDKKIGVNPFNPCHPYAIEAYLFQIFQAFSA